MYRAYSVDNKGKILFDKQFVDIVEMLIFVIDKMYEENFVYYIMIGKEEDEDALENE